MTREILLAERALTPPMDQAARVGYGTPALLSAADGASISLAVFHLVFSFVVSVVLWRLTAWQRRYEGLEDRLNDMTTRLVDERFRAMAHEFGSHVQGLVLAMQEMKERLHSGEGEFRAMGERDQRIELTVASKIDLLKDYIRDFAANKVDLEKHEASVDRKLCLVERRLGDLASTVAVLLERVKE